MSLVQCANQPDMNQDKVCVVLKEMDIMLHTMYTLIMQSTNIMEMWLTKLATNALLDKRCRSPVYYGDFLRYTFPLIKLAKLKNIEEIKKILVEIEFTRDAGMQIIDKFLVKTANYEQLTDQLGEVSFAFHKVGRNANAYNSLISQTTKIEQNVGGVRERLYGAIRNVKQLKELYHKKRNSIVLAYLKLNLGVACRLTTRVPDSFQNGVIGVLKAIDKSRVKKLEEKVFSFANFVKWHIKNAVVNTEFNPRTDLAFNAHPQVIKQMRKEALYRPEGERYIDMIEDLTYIPEYLEEQDIPTLLNSEELIIIALLNGDPSSCDFESYPTEEEIKKEVKRQKYNT